MKRIILRLAPLLDPLVAPMVWLAARLLRAIRALGLPTMPRSASALRRVGLLPVRETYYEPWVTPGQLRRPLDEERPLPGIDLDLQGQLSLLAKLSFGNELLLIPRTNQAASASIRSFHYRNDTFEAGDAEALYSMIRFLKPRRLIEIGAGWSTLMARKAIGANAREAPAAPCDHLVIEPYENPWLESTGARILRERLELLDPATFAALEAGDILFIDSSHVVRAQGDVVTEYLEILPTLRKGVWVHIHDIFTPRDYPHRWVIDEARLWTEQYLLEALLTENPRWRVRLAMNQLAHRHADALGGAFPVWGADRIPADPGSFWIERT